MKSYAAWSEQPLDIGYAREVEMNRKPVTSATWSTTIRRYAMISIIGVIICAYSFYRLYITPAGQPVPMRIVVGASIGGLMTASGVFGIAVSYFFKMLGKQ
jgi:hypothetical protein